MLVLERFKGKGGSVSSGLDQTNLILMSTALELMPCSISHLHKFAFELEAAY